MIDGTFPTSLKSHQMTFPSPNRERFFSLPLSGRQNKQHDFSTMAFTTFQMVIPHPWASS
jgi:hypothetical protein